MLIIDTQIENSDKPQIDTSNEERGNQMHNRLQPNAVFLLNVSSTLLIFMLVSFFNCFSDYQTLF